MLSVPEGATHCSTRIMANEMGLSQTAASRNRRVFGLQPHLQDIFKRSSDSPFGNSSRPGQQRRRQGRSGS